MKKTTWKRLRTRSGRQLLARQTGSTLAWMLVFATIIGVASARCYWAMTAVMAGGYPNG